MCARAFQEEGQQYLGDEARRKYRVGEARESWVLPKHLDRDQKKEESQARLGQALLIFLERIFLFSFSFSLFFPLSFSFSLSLIILTIVDCTI